ncbi:MAG TPA: TIGR04222 domain-containing membrane protein [Burkholderiaceae bacterium]|nr:TIGR04222 domain-containing membrane protein [Burkholderiaceae bacterium]
METAASRLRDRIDAWPLSPADLPLAFESRLAQDCGWTLGHALAVTREYRRFLLLTQVQSGGAPPRPVEPVAPSAAVDAAWHLHITQTSDYERFCFEVFGRFLHHHPARGGVEEFAQQRQMYARTLDVYGDVFGETPPAPLWPGVDARYAKVRSRQAIESVIPADGVVRGVLLVGGLAVATALALACSATGVLAPLRAIPGPLFALAYLVMLVGLALVGFVPERLAGGPRAEDAVEPYELAWMAGGVRRVAATAVVALVDAGRARLVTATTPARRPGRRSASAATRIVAETAFAAEAWPAHPAERAVLAVAEVQAIDFALACQCVMPEAAVIAGRLQAAGLAREHDALAFRRLATFAIALVLLAIVLERFAHAVAVQRPVEFLLLLLTAHLILVGALLLQRSRLTARGRLVLGLLRRQVPRPKVPRPAGGHPAEGNAPAGEAWVALPALVALFGAPAVMADPRFAGIEHAIGREGLMSSGAGAGGDGCSGGGGSGGSGCGGCGGGS